MRVNVAAGAVAVALFVVCTARIDPGPAVGPTPPEDSVSTAALLADVAQLDSFMVTRFLPSDMASHADATVAAQFIADTLMLHLKSSDRIGMSTARRDVAALLAQWCDDRTAISTSLFDSLAERMPGHYFGDIDQQHVLRGRTMRHPTRLPSRWLADSIAYLRADDLLFSEGGAAIVRRWFTAFVGARGLVVDLRGVAWASHADLAWILPPWLMAPGSAPRALGTAIVRLGPGMDSAQAVTRLRPWHYVLSTDSTLTAADRVAIARVEPFSGSALLPRFYLLARPNASGHALGGRPVVVLIDARCANACEAVAAALAALPNVTLLGQRTSGGAGITARLTLRHTGLAVDATIGRFLTATALPVDHTGVAPTIEMAGPDSVHAGTPDDRDPVLDHAIDRLKRRP